MTVQGINDSKHWPDRLRRSVCSCEMKKFLKHDKVI